MAIQGFRSGLFFCVLGFTPFALQEKPLQPQMEAKDADIESWVQDLANPDLDAREIATSKILDLGPRAFPYLEKAIKNSKDNELKWNAKRLMREIRESGKRAPAPPPPPAPPRPGEAPAPDRRMDELSRRMREQEQQLQKLLEENRPDMDDMDDMNGMDPFEIDLGDLRDRLHDLEIKVQGMGGGSFFSSKGMSRNFTFSQTPNGVHLETFDEVDGKQEKKTYDAENMEDFKAKYPEVAEKYGIGGSGKQPFVFRLDSNGQAPRLFWNRGGNKDFWVGGQGRAYRQNLQEMLPGDRLGVEIDTVEPSLATFLDLPEGVGLLVRGVEKESLAEKMGVKAKDVLVSINGNDIHGRETILDTLSKIDSGAEVKVDVQRPGSGRMTLKANKEKQKESRIRLLEKAEPTPK